MLYNNNAVPSNVHLWYRPVYGKRDWQVKTLKMGNNPDCKSDNRSCFPLETREISGEWKFGGHILPILRSKFTVVHKEPNSLFTRKRLQKELRLSSQEQCSLTWQNIRAMAFMAPQIIFCCAFIHVYTKQLSLLFTPGMNFLKVLSKHLFYCLFTVLFLFHFFPFYSRSQRSLAAHPKAC